MLEKYCILKIITTIFVELEQVHHLINPVPYFLLEEVQHLLVVVSRELLHFLVIFVQVLVVKLDVQVDKHRVLAPAFVCVVDILQDEGFV